MAGYCQKERGQYPAILTEQAWSIKDLLYDLKHREMIFDLAGPSEKSQAGSHIINHVNRITKLPCTVDCCQHHNKQTTLPIVMT